MVEHHWCAAEAQGVADVQHRVAGFEREAQGGGAVGFGAGEGEQADLGVLLGALLGDEVEEVEQQAVAVVACDVGAATLLADEDVFGDQFVDGLAHGADADAVAGGQSSFGRNGGAGFPFAAGQRGHQLALDVAVQGAGQRQAGAGRIGGAVGGGGHGGWGGGAGRCRLGAV